MRERDVFFKYKIQRCNKEIELLKKELQESKNLHNSLEEDVMKQHEAVKQITTKAKTAIFQSNESLKQYSNEISNLKKDIEKYQNQIASLEKENYQLV